MRAARYYGKEDIRMEDIDEPNLTAGRCIVDVEWCGICGSDLHNYIQGPSGMGGPPHPLTGETTPLAMGHEFCGRVRNPSTSSGLKDGDAVMVDPRILCRKCTGCNSGQTHGCECFAYLGCHASGGFAERCAVEERMLHKLPDNVPLEHAAVIEPLAVVVHAIRMTGLKNWREKDILILGGGPIGLALIIALKANGAEKIVVSEPTTMRKKQVLEFVDTVINPIHENVEDKCRELTGGRGVDIVFDCAGVPAGMETGFKALRLEGTYMNIAIWEKPMVIPMWTFMKQHITIKSALIFSDEDFSTTMAMMAEGRFVGYEKLITGRIALENIVCEGFEELIHNKDKHIKILVSARAQR